MGVALCTAPPGCYISICGTGLSDVTDFDTISWLPVALDFVHVSFDVTAANLSVPGAADLREPPHIDFTEGNVVTVPISNYAPAFFKGSPGVVAALNTAYQPVSASNPVRRGDVVQLYANGLCPVSNQPASGDPEPSSNLALTTTQPVVTIGGQQAVVQFSGLAPGFPGLYQINATVPSGLAAGTYPITVSIGGQTSKTSNISVQ